MAAPLPHRERGPAPLGRVEEACGVPDPKSGSSRKLKSTSRTSMRVAEFYLCRASFLEVNDGELAALESVI